MHPIHKFADMVGVFCDRLTAHMDADFKESEHPRAEDGKFGSGGNKSIDQLKTEITDLNEKWKTASKKEQPKILKEVIARGKELKQIYAANPEKVPRVEPVSKQKEPISKQKGKDWGGQAQSKVSESERKHWESVKPIVSGEGEDLITVYHGTSAANAEQIKKEGKIYPTHQGAGLYEANFSSEKSVAMRYAGEDENNLFTVQIPRSELSRGQYVNKPVQLKNK